MAASSATFSDEMKLSIPSAVFLLLFAASTSVLHAQLRPLEPSQWRLYEDSTIVRAELGGSRLWNQKASLAGEEGDLWEAGNFSLAWRTGRVILALSRRRSIQQWTQARFRRLSGFDYRPTDPGFIPFRRSRSLWHAPSDDRQHYRARPRRCGFLRDNRWQPREGSGCGRDGSRPGNSFHSRAAIRAG